jgi:mRNA interferase MazF
MKMMVISELGYQHPHVMIQNNVFNRSRIHTVIVCALTSNIRRADAPGNVLLESGETGLPNPSVAVVTQIFTVDKAQLEEHVGTLPKKRVQQILDGMRLVTEPREID